MAHQFLEHTYPRVLRKIPGLSMLGMAASLTVLPGGTALAQPQSERSLPQLEEIMVTAQRRSESSSDVGIAMAVQSGERLKNQGIDSSTDIALLIPGVSLSGTYGGQSVQFSIRGVTQSDFNDAIEAPVAVYVDDVYVASQQGQSVALFDIERVEVLKGPQGTLFGRNATGGLVHMVTNKPAIGEFLGAVEGSLASYDTRQAEVMLNLPLGDKFATRISGYWNSNNSVWRNDIDPDQVTLSKGGEDIGDQETFAGRAQLLYEVSDTFDVRLTLSAADQDLSESPWFSVGSSVETDGQGRVVGSEYVPATAFGYVPVDIDDRKVSKDFALSDLNRFESDGVTLHINKQFDDIEVVSVTSLANYEKAFMLDVDSSPVNFSAFGNVSDTETFSEEFRISSSGDRYQWTTGLYYLDIKAENAHGILGPTGSIFAGLFGMAAEGVDPLAVFQLDTESVSIFGQGSYDLTDQWRVIAGARFIREKQTYDYFTALYTNRNDYKVDVDSPIIALGPYPAYDDSRTEYLWAGKLQLEYRPDDSMFYYLGINRGVKAGSYNGQYFDGSPALAPADISYDPEELTSLEGGFKYTDPDQLYALNMSAFYYDYSDYQSFLFDTLSGSVRNYDANSLGLEAELTINFGLHWRATVTGAYIDAEVENFVIAPGIETNTAPTYTPEFAGSLRLDYTQPDFLNGEFNAGVTLNSQSEMYHNARNFNASKIDARTVIDLYANLIIENSSLTIGAFVNNVFDKRYSVVGLDLSQACGCNLEASGQPRTAGVRVKYDF